MKFLRILTKSEFFSCFLSVIFLLFLGTGVRSTALPMEEDVYTIRYTAKVQETVTEQTTPPDSVEETVESPAPENPSLAEPDTATPTENGMVNLNTATAEELDTLSGIGEVLAQRIIEYRTENNGFSTIEELMEVKGIGEKTFEKNRDRICVGS